MMFETDVVLHFELALKTVLIRFSFIFYATNNVFCLQFYNTKQRTLCIGDLDLHYTKLVPWRFQFGPTFKSI